jgi:hypothetical protein
VISEDVIKQIADMAESNRLRADGCRGVVDRAGPSTTASRLLAVYESLAFEYGKVVEFLRLLNADERLRDALAEARDRAADAETEGASDEH